MYPRPPVVEFLGRDWERLRGAYPDMDVDQLLEEIVVRGGAEPRASRRRRSQPTPPWRSGCNGCEGPGPGDEGEGAGLAAGGAPVGGRAEGPPPGSRPHRASSTRARE